MYNNFILVLSARCCKISGVVNVLASQAASALKSGWLPTFQAVHSPSIYYYHT